MTKTKAQKRCEFNSHEVINLLRDNNWNIYYLSHILSKSENYQHLTIKARKENMNLSIENNSEEQQFNHGNYSNIKIGIWGEDESRVSKTTYYKYSQLEAAITTLFI